MAAITNAMAAMFIRWVRWGNELTYTTRYFPERIAFLGIPKHTSVVCLGTYGCISNREDKHEYKAGLDALMDCFEPEGRTCVRCYA